jgi:hypothetical protein
VPSESLSCSWHILSPTLLGEQRPTPLESERMEPLADARAHAAHIEKVSRHGNGQAAFLPKQSLAVEAPKNLATR